MTRSWRVAAALLALLSVLAMAQARPMVQRNSELRQVRPRSSPPRVRPAGLTSV
jgi:membrane protein implicated in regulation of membrane protease activity